MGSEARRNLTYKIIKVKVIVNAKKNEVSQNSDGSFKVRVTRAPEKGRANLELIKVLSDYFDISQSQVEILKGEYNFNKIVKIG